MEYFFLGLGLYFLPSIIALGRHHHNPAPIIIVDLFLGWTLVGWVVALAMAFSKPPVLAVSAGSYSPPAQPPGALYNVYTGERLDAEKPATQIGQRAV